MTKTAAKLRAEADALEAKARGLREKASEARQAELEAQPLFDRLIYAANARCNCGAGLAYDPANKGDKDSPFKGPNKWECGDILRYKTLTLDEQAVVASKTHDRGFPFAFYEIKSENQPSANGQTTRPPPLINGGLSKSEAFTNPAPHSDMWVGPA